MEKAQTLADSYIPGTIEQAQVPAQAVRGDELPEDIGGTGY